MSYSEASCLDTVVLVLRKLSGPFSQTIALRCSCAENSPVSLGLLLSDFSRDLKYFYAVSLFSFSFFSRELFFRCIFLGKIVNHDKKPEVGSDQLRPT